MREDCFSSYHPLVNFIFFACVIVASAFYVHPVFLGICLVTAFVYEWILHGLKKTIKSFMLISVPMLLLVLVINPMFSHYGVTVLFYLENGNPITLESIVYGLALGVMLCQMLIWFRCFHQVMTSDKFVYLFGKLLPALSLILSMCLRFVPKLSKHAVKISQGQKCIGRDVSNGNFFKKIKNGITMLSILITWSLETALITADSMKSRGYGTGFRSAYSLYKFEKRDGLLLVIMGGLLAVFLFGSARGYTYANYNPKIVIEGIPLTVGSFFSYLAYGIFCLLPVLVDGLDALRWKKLRSTVVKSGKGAYRLWDF